MLAYTLRRLLLIIPTLLCILVVNFLIVQAAPGGPVEQAIARVEGMAPTGGIGGGGGEVAATGGIAGAPKAWTLNWWKRSSTNTVSTSRCTSACG